MEIIDYLLARKKAGGGSDVTIEQLTATENGTYSEEGKAYSPVVVNVPAPENSYQLKDAPSGTVSTIDDGTALPMPSLKVGIEPVQDLHEYDHPWTGGAGKNKLQNTATTQTMSGVTFTVNNDGTVIINGTASSVVWFKVNANITLSGEYILNGCHAGGDAIHSYSLVLERESTRLVTDTGNGATFNNDGRQCILYIRLGASTYNNIIFKPMIRLATETDATFAPYSNICPISGWTAANIAVSPTTSAEDGTTYTIDLDGTRYGGTLDVTSGELTVTDAYISSYNGETLPSTWISDRDVYAEGTTPTTGAEVVYKLANSVTYQLTPTQIRTLVGNNNIWADTGNIIEGKYFKSLT